MNKWLSNFQIDDFFKDEKNEDLKNIYMDTYSIDSITKYIHFYVVRKMSKKICFKTPFDSQHAKVFQTLLKPSAKHFYHIF